MRATESVLLFECTKINSKGKSSDQWPFTLNNVYLQCGPLHRREDMLQLYIMF